MRILTVGNMFPPHHLGGYELVWQSAVDHLRSHSHEVRVLTTDFRLPGSGAPDRGENDVHRELQSFWKNHEFPRLTLRERLETERHDKRVLCRHLDELRPDAVCWWSMGGLPVALIEHVRRRGIPTAGVVCDAWLVYAPLMDAWHRVVSKPLLRPVRPLVEAATGIPAKVDLSGTHWLLISEALRRHTVEESLDLGRTEVVHPGVDPDLFFPAPPTDWGWRLLYAGRIDARKGIDTAIEALTLLPPEATLTVDGPGDEREIARLRDICDQQGLAGRVRFVRSSRHRLREVYAASDVVVFPVRWDEPWGLVPLEAMAVGRPVAATGRGGSGEYMRHERNALLFDESSADALARAVSRLASDADLRARLREGGLRTAARYTQPAFNQAVEDALTQLV